MNNFNIKKLLTDYNDGKKISMVFQYPSDETILLINSLLSQILSKNDLIYIIDTIITISRELIFNAVKANAKRIYFEKLNLDINDDFEYTSTIKEFKQQVINNFDLLKNDMIDSKYDVAITMQKIDTEMIITISNNVPLLPLEKERILHRKEVALECDNFSEAYDRFYDSTEGAGLGIILSVLLMKNAGMSGDCFIVETNDIRTITTLRIPQSTQPRHITSEIKKQIYDEIDSLPTFPENILELREMCANTHTRIEDIANKVLLDPSLTADVLRLSNSAGFVFGKRIATIEQAIKIIGLKNFNLVLTTTAARQILDRRYQKFEDIWNHCNKTAFYCRKLSEISGKNKIAEQAALAGLLHDIGKIVLLTLKPDLAERIQMVIQNRKVRSSSIIEEISIGISHAEIGSIIAEKWNFPAYLIEAIRYHHSPMSASAANRDMVSTVYLANMISGIETNKYSCSYIDSTVLESFKLSDPNDFTRVTRELFKSYQSRDL